MSTETKTHFETSTDSGDDTQLAVDIDELRAEVRHKYRAVAEHPDGEFHFHTGRYVAQRFAYDADILSSLPDRAVESFAGVANPFALRTLEPGERVVDVGSGGGFDSFVATRMVGGDGYVVGVDMTPEMLSRSRAVAAEMGVDNIEFCEGFIEDLPVDDGWADVVISNGVINLSPDKKQTFDEILRVLRPGGVLQFADIANGNPVPEEAMRHIDLWTD